MTKAYHLPILETERLFLLPWQLSYAEDMLLFASNKNVIGAAGGWKLITETKKAKEKINGFLARNKDEWAIAIKTEQALKIIGSIGMHQTTSKKYALSFDFGYLIAEEYWGHGYATEAAKKLMHYAFVGLKCDAMTVSHKVFNHRSKRVIEKVGLSFQGIYPKHSPENPDAVARYILTKEDYFSTHDEELGEYENLESLKQKYAQKKLPVLKKPQLQTKQVKGSPYSLQNPIRIIEKITYIKQPTEYLCGQTCIAMLGGVSVDEVIQVMQTDKGTNKQHLKKALDYYGIRYAPRSRKVNPAIPLPPLCILRMKVSQYNHWSLYYNGTYYDPEFGVSSGCPPQAKIFQIWEINPL